MEYRGGVLQPWLEAGAPESEAEPPAIARWVEVLVDCPGAQGLFTYGVPDTLTVAAGDILSVPFGSQQVGAIALRELTALPDELQDQPLKQVEEVVSRGFFPPTYWALLQRVADYYCTPLMSVIRVALPPGLLGRSQRRLRLRPEAMPAEAEAFLSGPAQDILARLRGQKQGNYSWQYLQQKVKGASRGLKDLLQRGWVESYLEPPTLSQPKRQQAVTLIADFEAQELSPRQREVLEVLRRQGGDLWLTELLQLCQASSSVVKALAQKGLVVVQPREVLRSDRGVEVEADQPKELTPAQAEALGAIAPLAGYAQVLLHGVTGSGKTEVYLQAIAPRLAQGQSVLVLVPEIGLTPQLTDRFRARFGGRVCVYHSALSDGERYDTWRQMLSGEPQVVIGTRSAVFAPLPHLGLIILDEEHDSSFKQDQPAPCYHARTVATWRAEGVDCPIILGSATPSLETWLQLRSPQDSRSESAHEPPRYYLSLPERVQSRPLPPIRVIDMRQEFHERNRSIFSRSLQQALQQIQERQQQGILFIHRRGHSTFVSCRSCGHVIECPNCDVSLSYHHTHADATPLLRCHYCNYGCPHPTRCPECSSTYLKNFGSGTQRVVQELAQLFPELRVLRFDSDTTRTKGSHRALLSRFAAGDADLLVGTQMLAKGLDLPQVTLVGIVAADGLLNLADYRASERAFQVLTQVAGRSGRGEDPGRVILQTYTPDHPVITAVANHEFDSFINAELAEREALNYPPYGRLVLLRFSSLDPVAVQQAAEAIAEALDTPDAPYDLLGPAPAPVLRVARRYRWHLLLKLGLQDDVMLPDVTLLRSLCPRHVSVTVDVDPLNL